MKLRKRINALILTLIIILNFLSITAIPTFAHGAMLEVDYDNCQDDRYGDGIDEVWYILEKDAVVRHIDHEVYTIKYYFAEEYQGNELDWTPVGQSISIGDEIKTAYANSMKKWNNVYFYSYNQYGTVTKNKIINVVEGTANDHNLIIYPITGLDGIFAITYPLGGSGEIEIETGTVTHTHFSDWEMLVNIDYFYEHGLITNEIANFMKDREGAHELGHIFGLRDVDHEDLCGSNLGVDHHYELLMGYGKDMLSRSSNITYKDIAGVAITRGFHTDYDHKWLNCGLQSDGKYKLLCSICNGVKNVDNLDGYTYNTYNACGGNHTLSGGNMLAVASYGTQDYYKCKYCRYVAPFSAIVSQDYDITYYTDSLHKCVNTVAGLEYTFYEEHTVVDHECTECGEHIHSYTHNYVWQSEGFHKSYCACGEYTTSGHVVANGTFNNPSGYGFCLLCHGRVFMGVMNVPDDELAYTNNGSVILTNGTIVLAEEDIASLMADTLEFSYGEKE